MTKARLIRIVCIACKGSGELGWLTGHCPRCDGAGKVAVEKALVLAEERYDLAGGGLKSGDYGLGTYQRMRDEAEEVFRIAGVTPPWRSAEASR
jgi:hypothetical protein